MRKTASILLILTLLCACLGGCAKQTATGSVDARVSLPEPPQVEAAQILGGGKSTDRAEVTLYYPSADGRTLSGVTRTVVLDAQTDMTDAILSELFSGSAALGADITGTALLNVESACRTACVNLNLDTCVNRSEQDFYLLCASIANTLIASGEVDAVNILADGQAVSVAELPVGAFGEPAENPAAAYAQIRTESDRLNVDASGLLSRTALLYYPSSDGRYLLPESRAVTVAAENPAQSVLDALAQPPQRSCCIGAIPSNLDLFEAPPSVTVTERGEAVVELRFSAALANYLAFAGIAPWQLYGAAVLSVCTFVPEIAGIRVFAEGQPVSSLEIAGVIRDFSDGILRRTDFAAQIGSSANLAFAGENGGLTLREYALSASAAVSPMGLLTALIETNASDSVFPMGVRASDILGTDVQNGVATVNLSGNFYARCQSMDDAQERRLVYAMIDTLCALPRIGAVRFTVEGRSVETLAGSIYLKTALMPDPGILE